MDWVFVGTLPNTLLLSVHSWGVRDGVLFLEICISYAHLSGFLARSVPLHQWVPHPAECTQSDWTVQNGALLGVRFALHGFGTQTCGPDPVGLHWAWIRRKSVVTELVSRECCRLLRTPKPLQRSQQASWREARGLLAARFKNVCLVISWVKMRLFRSYVTCVFLQEDVR